MFNSNKKRFTIFPSPVWMPLTKPLTLAWNNLIIPRESLVSDIPAGDGKIANLFLQCNINSKNGRRREKGEGFSEDGQEKKAGEEDEKKI